MINFRLLFSVLIIILVVSNCTPTKLTYISFGRESASSAKSNFIIHYKNRLDIKSEFIELGVISVEGMQVLNISEISLLASKKGADGTLKEGKNFVLIKVLNNQNPQEIINQNSREVINVYEYKKPTESNDIYDLWRDDD